MYAATTVPYLRHVTDKTAAITALMLKETFDLEGEGMDLLRKALATKIEELLKNNPILLRSIFYRIDLNESQLGIALGTMEGEELYNELADQVIERMKRKAETRLKYS